MITFSTGNRKLKKNGIISFGIPAFKSADGFKTCPMAGICAGLCYARQGAYTWAPVRKARERNLQATREPGFTRDCIDILKKKQAKIIRIHDSGDFYDQKYLDSWITISKALPNKIFYAYTKMLNLNYSNLPNNFRVIQSAGGLLDYKIDYSKPHSRIFKDYKTMIDSGYTNGNDSDMVAVRGTVKIGLAYHGVKKLSKDQELNLK